MSTTLSRETERDSFMTVTVRDPNGHRSVVLEGVRSSTTAAEIQARAIAALHLPADIEWNLRQDDTGRLVREEQRLREFAGDKRQTELTMQPDAALG